MLDSDEFSCCHGHSRNSHFPPLVDLPPSLFSHRCNTPKPQRKSRPPLHFRREIEYPLRLTLPPYFHCRCSSSCHFRIQIFDLTGSSTSKKARFYLGLKVKSPHLVQKIKPKMLV